MKEITAESTQESPVASRELRHLMALLSLPGMGPKRLRNLTDTQTGEAAWALIKSGDVAGIARTAEVSEKVARSWYQHAVKHSLEDSLARYEQHSVKVSRFGDANYPRRLIEDIEPPEVLFWTGDVGLADADTTVGIVGTRTCTNYGKEVAFELGRELAQAGVGVVSGLALGIDAAGHRGALAGEGTPPVAVVGSGIDIVYPKANRQLWEEVAQRGAILSETPLGVHPEPWRFPSRNRIIAALSDVLVVVESLEEGGALFTAEEAAQRGIPVFAVPGPIRSRASSGTNRLIAEGCMPMCDVTDIFVALGVAVPPEKAKTNKAKRKRGRGGRAAGANSNLSETNALDPAKQKILEAFGWQPASLEQLTSRSDMSLSDAAVHIDELLSLGLVERNGLWYERKKGGASQ